MQLDLYGLHEISLIIENYTKLFAGVTGKQVVEEWTAIKRILVHRPSLMSMPVKRAAAKTAQAEASARCAPECPGTAGQPCKTVSYADLCAL